MNRRIKRACILILCILAAAAGLVTYVYSHTVTTLEYRYVGKPSVVELHETGRTVVRISGFSFHAALAVKKITTERDASSIVVLVQLFLTRRGRSGTFQYDVLVPDSVDEIRFGKEKTLIWKRPSLPGVSESPPHGRALVPGAGLAVTPTLLIASDSP